MPIGAPLKTCRERVGPGVPIAILFYSNYPRLAPCAPECRTRRAQRLPQFLA